MSTDAEKTVQCIEETLLAYCRQQGLFKSGDRVIAAYSGGADSMALLLFLLRRRKDLAIEVLATHVNHGIRGASARADANFVTAFCRRNGVELFLYDAEKEGVPIPPQPSEEWARELGCDAVHGPLGFTDMDREGMLVEGFDRRSCFFTYYNYPYYIDHMTALGYGKDVDWIEELITVPTDEATIKRWEKISDFVLKRHHLHVHKARNRLSYLPLLKPFFELVNLAYAPLYSTVDLSEQQVRKYSAKFAPLINPNTTCFVMDEENRMVAFGVGAPSLASAMQKHRGRLFPTGWVDVLKAFRRNDTVDLLLIAVHPDYQKKGVNAVILSQAMKGCIKMGIKQAETGPMLELNDKVQSQWKDFETEQHKRRRCFIKELT